jgi:ribosomal subunit interface protein
MKTIIESINFEPSISLNKFIKEKAENFLKLDSNALYAEFNLSKVKNEFHCTVILNLSGKDIVANRKADDMHYAVLKAIDSAKRGMRKKKMKHLALSKK